MDAYHPCLLYELPFNPTEEMSEDAYNLVVVNYNNNTAKFQGRSVEELLLTHETFVAMMKSMMLDKDDWIREWRDCIAVRPLVSGSWWC